MSGLRIRTGLHVPIRQFTPPSMLSLSLSWSEIQAKARRRNRLRFVAGLVAGFVLIVVVPWVVVAAFLGMP